MSPFHLKRRAVLQALSAGGAGMLLPSLRPAYAADAIPKRLIIFYTMHGQFPALWKPKGLGGGEPTETGFELNDIHKPLQDYKNDLLFVSGPDMRSWSSSTLMACGHTNGQAHSLTSVPMVGKTGGGLSIDQFVANRQKALNGGVSPTRIPSLTLAIGGAGNNNGFFSGPAQHLVGESNPRRVYDRLFPNGQAPSTGIDVSAATARRKSALSIAGREFAALSAKLSSEERTKLDAHASMISDLETRLQSTAARSCMAPVAPSAGTTWQAGADMMPRLVQSALACDLTRVVGIWAETPPDNTWGYQAGQFGTSDNHDFVHRVEDRLAKDAGAIALMKNYHLGYANVFGKLLGLLKATPESDGKTLLDHTVVLWAGELAQSGHGCTNLKWMLAGSAGGYFKTGRYLNWGDFNRDQYVEDKTVPSHADLLVSLANAVGVPDATFGDPSFCKGQIRAVARLK